MGKFFKFLGVGVAGFVVIVAGLFAYAMIHGSALDSESKAYVDQAVVAITSHWSAHALKDRAAPKLLAATTPAQLDNLFGALSGLGELKKYEGAKGEANFYASIGNENVSFAAYVARAQYENGEATINILIQKTNGAWHILGFHVNSPALAVHPGRQHI